MKLFILLFIVSVGLPIGLVGARLLYRWGNQKLLEMRDNHNQKFFNR